MNPAVPDDAPPPSSPAAIAAAWLARRLDRPELAAPAARLWQACEDGHTAMPLDELGPAARHLAGAAPYVVVEDGWAAIARLDAAERRLAAALARLAAGVAEPPGTDPAALFPDGGAGAAEQVAAVRAALGRHLAVIAGGPGTGKTFAVQRLLAALLADAPDLAVAVAAPTGKAARRVRESMLAGLDRLGVAEAVRGRIAEIAGRATTLHRLLGWNPASGRLRHGPGRPLPLDVLVVDEASMVDLVLFDAVAAALAPACRLVVLGDPCQLASVEEGVVLGDLVAALAGHPSLSRLSTSRRFTDDGGIGAVAAALRRGLADGGAAAAARAGDEAWRALTSGSATASAVTVEAALAAACSAWRDMATAGDGDQARLVLARAAVLTPLREGPRGVAGLNQRIAAAMGIVGERSPGRPILVETSDPALGLANGDLGVLWPDGAGVLHAWFDGNRRVPAAQLPPHQTAWATTVHKSQGSEWPLVAVILPDSDHRLLTAELLYTAATRARERLVVAATQPVLAAAAMRSGRRRSRLAARIAAGLAGGSSGGTGPRSA